MRLLIIMTLIFLQLLILNQSAVAQDEDYSEEEYTESYAAWMFEASYTLFDPINTFGRAVEGAKSGFNISVLKQAKPGSDMFFGLSGYYTQLGNDVQENVTSQGEAVDDIASSNVLGFDFTLRYYPDLVFGIVEPFVEAHLGTRFYYTITKSYFPVFDETIDYRANETNSSLAYGFGLGTHVVIDESWALNFKCSYQLANIARYYVKNGENNVDPLENFDLEFSSTDWIRYDIGVSFIF